MKNLFSVLMIAGMILGFSACSDDSPTIIVEKDPVVKSGVISVNETWTSDVIYELDGRVIVDNGVTLTIEAGTIIKGYEGEAENASVLIVSRGGKISAIGTALAPIIFTSILDGIELGENVSTLVKENNETWGGIIILGDAPISAKSGDTESSIEGLPANESYGKYGGNNAADNSGTLKYVSIRFGGITIGEGNEINGLTLGGVGSGTTIDNIEIFATLDDGIEFFGGTVNVSNALVAWQGDDGIDIDQNYAGTITNFVVTHGAGVGTDEGLEIDGPEGTAKNGYFTLKNGTIINDGNEGSAADLKSDAQGTIDNIVFQGYNKASIKVEGEYDQDDCTDHATKTYSDALQHLIKGDLVVKNSKFDEIKVTSKKNDQDVAKCSDISQSDKDAASNVATPDANATGANTSVFSWTAAVQTGLLEL